MATTYRDRGRRRAWAIIAVLFACTAALMGSAIFGFVMIADILARSHHWSEIQSGSLVSAMWLVAPLALVAAPVIERVGPWMLIVGGLLVLAGAFASLALATVFWQVYALRVLMGFGKVAIMTSAPVVVARWFDARFNTAIAIVWAGGSAGGIVAAPFVEYLNRTRGLQATAFALALVLLAVAVAATAAAQLSPPNDRATAADAKEDDPHRPSPELPASGPARLGAPLIGGIIAATIGLGAANVAFIALNPSLVAGLGMGLGIVALVVATTAGAAMAGSLGIGWLTDRIGVESSAAVMSIVYLLGVLCSVALIATLSAPVALAGAALVGSGAGAAEVLWISLLKREADVRGFPRAYGIWYFALQGGYALGGVVGGWALVSAGGTGFILAVATAFAATPLFVLWRRLRRPSASATSSRPIVPSGRS